MSTIITALLLVVAWIYHSLPHLYVNERILHRDRAVSYFYRKHVLIALGFVLLLVLSASQIIQSTLHSSTAAHVHHSFSHDNFLSGYRSLYWLAQIRSWHERIMIRIIYSTIGICLITFYMPLIVSTLFRLRRGVWRTILYGRYWKIYNAHWRTIEAETPRLPFPYRPLEPLLERVPWPVYPQLSQLSPLSMSVFFEYGPWNDPEHWHQEMILERERWDPAAFDRLISNYPDDAETHAVRSRCLDVHCFLTVYCDTKEKLEQRLQAVPEPSGIDPHATAAELIARAFYMPIDMVHRATRWLDGHSTYMTTVQWWYYSRLMFIFRLCIITLLLLGKWTLGLCCRGLIFIAMSYYVAIKGACVVLYKLWEWWLTPRHLARWKATEQRMYYTSRTSAHEWYNDEYLPSEQLYRELSESLEQQEAEFETETEPEHDSEPG